MVDNLRADDRYLKYQNQLYVFEETVNMGAKKKRALLDDAMANQYEVTLLSHMKEQEVFLDSGITLRSLADQIGVQANQLSWLLNAKIGKSFNEFINSYRIE
ncbi:MAG: hypothetical protein ACPG21_04575 [Crocinitomicaceae bacterium]